MSLPSSRATQQAHNRPLAAKIATVAPIVALVADALDLMIVVWVLLIIQADAAYTLWEDLDG